MDNPTVERDVVHAKLESLRRCVARVEAVVPPTAKRLAEDIDAQDIVSLNLVRAVQVCVDIAAHLVADHGCPVPDTMAGCFDALARQGIVSEEVAAHMKRAVGFRNMSVHAYDMLDWDLVHAIATTRMDDFAQFAQSAEAFLDRRSPDA